NHIDDKLLNIESTFPIKYVTILNQQGQQVQSIQGFNRIKLQEELMLSPGLYFVVVEGEEYDQRIAKQLIVH
ncbi:MAG: T9SS type A sorting domain-containing protein, partial [Flavobacteriales bacterium]|nr:T9SS type A sorting domain-containing protein [Flavobacteriales bacterium]